jgi:HK97 family phage portal protein
LKLLPQFIRNLWPPTATEKDIASGNWGDINSETTDLSVNSDSILGIPALWRGVQVIANDIARLPLNVYDQSTNGAATKLPDHDLNDVLDLRTWKWLPAFDWRQRMQIDAIMHGNAYARIVKDSTGQIRWLKRLDPDVTQPVVMGFGTKEELIYRTTESGPNGGISKTYRDDQIVHIRSVVGDDGVAGIPIYDMLQFALKGVLATQRYHTIYFEQGGQVAGYLKHPLKLNPEQVKDLTASWRSMAAGMGNAHKTGVLQGGLEYVPVTSSASEAQLVDARKLSIIDIANIIGVRPHDIGATDMVAYNSLEQENHSHVDRNIDPHLMRWQQELSYKLLTEEQRADGHCVRFGRKKLVRVTLEQQSLADRNYREIGVNSVDEIRDGLELGPIKGDGGDDHHKPMNWTRLNANDTTKEVGQQPEQHD